MSDNRFLKLAVENLKNVEASGKVIYSIFDAKCGFMDVMAMPNDGIAIRQFTEIVNNENSPIAKYYNDFALVRLAIMNEITGELTPDYKTVCEAKDVKQGVNVLNDNHKQNKKHS